MSNPSDTPRILALVPCAGSGSRAGTAMPKQYQPVAGRAMLWHALVAFAQAPSVDASLLVLAPDDAGFAAQPWPAELDSARLQVARCGGSSRAESVRNGLLHLRTAGYGEQDWVLVHDAARCLITPEQIETLVTACRSDPVGGLLALPLPDTLKSAVVDAAAPRVHGTVSRADKWLAQTPQMFRLGLLLQALDAGLSEAPEAITDESSAIERLGHAPLLVRGSAQNFKVTYPEDFALAEAVLQARAHPSLAS